MQGTWPSLLKKAKNFRDMRGVDDDSRLKVGYVIRDSIDRPYVVPEGQDSEKIYYGG